MSTLSLAKGVEFDEAKHEYWYKGQRLSGVTGLISKKLGIKMPQEFVEEHQMEGIHIHKAVQKWIATGDPESIHPGVQWVATGPLAYLRDRTNLFAEVLVSDFRKYASAVDIVVDRGAWLEILDIKKGSMNRPYVTWQLSIYKYFIEKYSGRKVVNCTCVCIRDREYYPIFPKKAEEVEKLLYG
jgi:hypothetical protein